MIDRYSLPKMREIWSEDHKFRTWLEVELAACEAWAKLGEIPQASLKKIKSKANFSIKRINEIEKTVDHDVIAFLTSVAENVGQDSRFIHMGLTSSDVCDTALSLVMRDAANVIIQDIDDFLKVLNKMARKYKDIVMMGRSHGVHAEPMTMGLKFALWLKEMERNRVRMISARQTINVGQISGAVGTYSNLDPRVELIACKKLGLEAAPISNQIIQRDRHAEFMSTLAIVAATLEKIALEIRGLQKTEIGEVEEPFKKGQKGSSAMPHKKNPVSCERICGLARIVRANAMISLENIALWHERDISHSSTERIMIPDSTILVDYMLQKMIYIIDNLVVLPERMKQNIEKSLGLTFSQRLLLTLTNKGLTREQAYQIVQAAAMKTRTSGKHLQEIMLFDVKARKYLSANEINQAFDIKYYLRNIDVIFKRLGL
ncbi:adenylosuccinate lyase [candidate division WOR-1 bacterium RIFCSPLOWO2_02_FULL_46_20]|uniref:Adenylosuccinate lyase n=2 Tax=Saganbacteria TaxID=1703751 RepID=A0A1F4RD61_UNCSA|nr:MAG: adenylosuccinate lyase [candidate division WOR-1 bacterium RIFCSPHIGHO2_02_FULL_45_12]OGC06110.1 MAG: adenylosuccinate lyase [candidate division WOR-1 bacterium RIFCSPLOWO2_02_FULL_46_20]OGC09384.1 MAG: adenylosuccinate lyase [candidate division WOR-1 bacterium RIFCSPLOWO2_12_FULL_45_9]